ncbi:MAG: group 1 truncated hemoglobin [Candidatus Rokubacteria bacterium]|nr:group 1 truncated hemoglobin [Candidatus Rokubacteria bacterium]
MKAGRRLGRKVTLLLAVVVVVVGGLAGCAAMMGEPEPTLYKRLGGRDGIALVVDDFVANVVADARVNARFKGMQPPAVFKLKSNLSDQICDATGGPCSYLGRDMKTAHKGMNITDAEWNATVENLVKALDKHRAGGKEKSELLGVLGPMKGAIVGQ